MEDVLEVYTRPDDPARPLVCLTKHPSNSSRKREHRYPCRPDDQPVTITNTSATAPPACSCYCPTRRLATRQGHRATHDHRLRAVLQELSDIHFAEAEKIVLVQDNLNTHNPASLYEAFTASEARRLVERFEWHYTPKHGSWLNMTESELAILSSQCLDLD